jgi:hypothetical protein
MTTWYLMVPGTAVSVSRSDANFRPHTTKRMLQFKEPAVTTDGEMIFRKGGWRVLVERAKVVVSHQQGTYGWNQWGA